MANKVAVASGILGLVVSFLASIPVGIVFAGGATGLANISLDLFHTGTDAAYVWGRISSGTIEAWLQVVDGWLLYGAGMFGLAVVGAALALGGAFAEKSGRRVVLAAFILELAVLGIALLDQFFLGFTIPGVAGAAWGGGMYLLIISVVLHCVAWRVHPAGENLD